MSLVEIKEVSRFFGDFVAVNNVSLSVNKGEFFTLLGPSGCGKTTLLRMLAGFDLPDKGQILLNGVDLVNTPPELRPVRTVFQSYALFPHMTVSENIAFPLKMAKTPKNQIKNKIHEVLEDVRLLGKEERYPHELSGGQRQRVAIARALVTHPEVLLLDEPLAALDAKLREQMQIELIDLQKKIGITFIYVTHDQVEALALSHRIAVMNHGQVEQLDEPDNIYSFPKTEFVADFIGNCNVLDCTISKETDQLLYLDVQGLGEVKLDRSTLYHEKMAEIKKGHFVLRPEKVKIATNIESDSQENLFKGVVCDLLYQGDVTVYNVELPNGALIEALLANSAPGRVKFFEVGDSVNISWRNEVGLFITD